MAANILKATIIKLILSKATLVNKATFVIINNSIKEINPINLLTLACEESDNNSLIHFNIKIIGLKLN